VLTEVVSGQDICEIEHLLTS